jgi:hypothetical protein
MILQDAQFNHQYVLFEICEKDVSHITVIINADFMFWPQEHITGLTSFFLEVIQDSFFLPNNIKYHLFLNDAVVGLLRRIEIFIQLSTGPNFVTFLIWLC